MRIISSVKFQFHKGTIKTCLPIDVVITDLLFQFHKGTIKTLFWLFIRRFIIFVSIP